MTGLPGGAVRRVTFQLSFVAAAASNQQPDASLVYGPVTKTFTGKRACWGMSPMVELGEVRSWSAAEAKLRGLGLVHSDGCLHICGLVTDIV
jgi:hypothetical protein